jgi:hypothetical protein
MSDQSEEHSRCPNRSQFEYTTEYENQKKKPTENHTFVYTVLKSRQMYSWKTDSSVDIASRNFCPFHSVCIVTHARCNALFCDQIFSCVPTALFLSLTPTL